MGPDDLCKCIHVLISNFTWCIFEYTPFLQAVSNNPNNKVLHIPSSQYDHITTTEEY